MDTYDYENSSALAKVRSYRAWGIRKNKERKTKDFKRYLRRGSGVRKARTGHRPTSLISRHHTNWGYYHSFIADEDVLSYLNCSDRSYAISGVMSVRVQNGLLGINLPFTDNEDSADWIRHYTIVIRPMLKGIQCRGEDGRYFMVPYAPATVLKLAYLRSNLSMRAYLWAMWSDLMGWDDGIKVYAGCRLITLNYFEAWYSPWRHYHVSERTLDAYYEYHRPSWHCQSDLWTNTLHSTQPNQLPAVVRSNGVDYMTQFGNFSIEMLAETLSYLDADDLVISFFFPDRFSDGPGPIIDGLNVRRSVGDAVKIYRMLKLVTCDGRVLSPALLNSRYALMYEIRKHCERASYVRSSSPSKVFKVRSECDPNMWITYNGKSHCMDSGPRNHRTGDNFDYHLERLEYTRHADGAIEVWTCYRSTILTEEQFNDQSFILEYDCHCTYSD